MNRESQLIALLLASLVRPFVLVAAAGLVLRIFRVRHPASRHAVWSVVLFAMLLLPVVSVIVPHWSLPASPRMEEPPAPKPPVFLAPEPIQPIQPPQAISLPSPPAPAKTSLSTLVFFCARFYLAGLFAMLLYRAVGWFMLRRVVARSIPIKGRVLRESRDVIAPVAVGVLRPAVILPTGWRDWNAETRRAVLAHEFAHIRRNDTLISALARFTRCVLWFHPLAWWISRRVAELAELACDAVALESLQDPGKYSRILLAFASGVNRAGSRVALPGLAMAASSSGMGRRIDQVFELADGSARKLARPGALLALIGLPVMCLAATVGLRESPLQLAQASPQPRPTPAQPQAAARPPAPSTSPAEPEFDAAAVRVNKLSDAPEMVEITNPRAAGVAPVEVMIYSDGHTARESAFTPNGSVTLRYVTMRQLITQAYIKEITRDDYLVGGPGWLDSDHFDLIAKAPPNTSVDTERLMVQRVLAERFHLALHREPKPLPAYALVVGKKGLKLQPTTGSGDPNCKTTAAGFLSADGKPLQGGQARSGFVCTNITLAEFANRLTDRPQLVTAFGDRPVVDLTGIKGAYDFQAEWAFPLPERDAPPATPEQQSDQRKTAADAVEQQLGLKIEEQKLPVPVIVIDRVDRVPTEN